MKVETDVSVGQAMDHRADDRAEQTPAATSDNTRTVANNGNLEVAVGSASMEVVPDEQKAEPTKGSGGTSIIFSGDVKGNVGVPPGSHELDLGIPKVSSADNTTAPARTANDTAATTQPAPQQPIALTPTKTSRIEIGLLAGGFNTMSQYSGITTANWDSDVRGKTSMGYGAELMKMGAHFGFGSGIHYSSYAERIRSNELNSNMESHSTSYYLMPVDTSFMVILGTDTIDGVVHYVTGQLHTTINTLASHTDTTNVMIRKREAHEFVNTVSYVEIPLLLDAHTRHGHWNFGVRGGPTIGLLTSRRGALPNAALDGYTDLNTEQFSSTVFGYTARIYVRYALGPAWAIGIEPTVKGQLTSTLAQSDLSRKSSAFGAFLSVTYRLP